MACALGRFVQAAGTGGENPNGLAAARAENKKLQSEMKQMHAQMEQMEWQMQGRLGIDRRALDAAEQELEVLRKRLVDSQSRRPSNAADGRALAAAQREVDTLRKRLADAQSAEQEVDTLRKRLADAQNAEREVGVLRERLAAAQNRKASMAPGGRGLLAAQEEIEALRNQLAEAQIATREVEQLRQQEIDILRDRLADAQNAQMATKDVEQMRQQLMDALAAHDEKEMAKGQVVPARVSAAAVVPTRKTSQHGNTAKVTPVYTDQDQPQSPTKRSDSASYSAAGGQVMQPPPLPSGSEAAPMGVNTAFASARQMLPGRLTQQRSRREEPSWGAVVPTYDMRPIASDPGPSSLAAGASLDGNHVGSYETSLLGLYEVDDGYNY